jgi:hypothetical protein
MDCSGRNASLEVSRHRTAPIGPQNLRSQLARLHRGSYLAGCLDPMLSSTLLAELLLRGSAPHALGSAALPSGSEPPPIPLSCGHSHSLHGSPVPGAQPPPPGRRS